MIVGIPVSNLVFEQKTHKFCVLVYLLFMDIITKVAYNLDIVFSIRHSPSVSGPHEYFWKTKLQ